MKNCQPPFAFPLKSDQRVDKILNSPIKSHRTKVKERKPDSELTKSTPVPKEFNIPKLANEKELINVQNDLAEVEYLEQLSKTNKPLFDKLVQRKVDAKTFNTHYQDMKSREKITESRIEALKQVYNPENECSFKPQISLVSRRILPRSPSQTKCVNLSKGPMTSNKEFNDLSFKKNRVLKVNAISGEFDGISKLDTQIPCQSTTDLSVRSCRSANKFNQSKFNAHMKRLNEWDDRSRNRRAKKLLQEFVDPQHVSNTPVVAFKGFGKLPEKTNHSFVSFKNMAKMSPIKSTTNYFDEDRSGKKIR